MLYIGSSAGAVIAAPDLSLEVPFDDRENPVKLKSYGALNLVSVLVMPHWGNESYKENYLTMLSNAYGKDTPVLSLTDDQALEITNKQTKIITSITT